MQFSATFSPVLGHSCQHNSKGLCPTAAADSKEYTYAAERT